MYTGIPTLLRRVKLKDAHKTKFKQPCPPINSRLGKVPMQSIQKKMPDYVVRESGWICKTEVCFEANHPFRAFLSLRFRMCFCHQLAS